MDKKRFFQNYPKKQALPRNVYMYVDMYKKRFCSLDIFGYMRKKRLFQSDLKKRALPRNVDMYVDKDKNQNFRIYGRLFRTDLKIT